MSFTAFIAFENHDGTYDIHYSNNGGDDYTLTKIAQEYVSGNTNRTADDIPRSKAFCNQAIRLAAGSTRSDDEEAQLSNAEVINSDTFATNVNKTDIVAEISSYDAELLCVVPYRSKDVKTYIPINPSLTALYHTANNTKLSMFRPQKGENPQEMLEDESRQPDAVISEDDFAPADINDSPYWVTKSIEQAHRYIYDKIVYMDNIKDKEDIENTVGTVLFLGSSIVRIELTTPLQKQNATRSIPIRVPFDDDDNPLFPMTNSLEMMGSIPKAYASEQRFNEYSDYYYEINTDDQDRNWINKKYRDRVAKKVAEEYGNLIDFELVSEQDKQLLQN